MVKLLRLTTDDDGKFNADLDAGIDVGVNGSIAVQNLTFETIFDVLDVNATNQEVTVQWDSASTPASSIITSELSPIKYNITNANALFADVQDTLNGTQGTPLLDVGLTNEQDNYAEFTCILDEVTGATDISYKGSPLCMPFFDNATGAIRPDGTTDNDMTLWEVSRIPDDDGSGGTTPALGINGLNDDGGIRLGNMFHDLSIVNPGQTALATHFAYPTTQCGQLSRGSGVFFCNIAVLMDNLDAADTNGFSIGLSFTDIQTIVDPNGLSEIPLSARDFELRVKRPIDVFEYYEQSQPGVVQTGTTRPFNYSLDVTNPADHDIMMLERSYDDIVGYTMNIDNVGYQDLAGGGLWTETTPVATSNFVTTDLGERATYKYVQVGGAVTNWWQTTGALSWDIFNTKPTATSTADSTATIVRATGVITEGANTLTPAVIPVTIQDLGKVGNKTEVFRYSLTEAQRGKPLYPYIAVFGELAGQAVVGHPVFTPLVLDDNGENLDYQITGQSQVVASDQIANYNGFDLYSVLNTNYTGIFPDLNDSLYEIGQPTNQNLKLSMNKDIWAALGFRSLGTTGFESTPFTFQFPDTNMSINPPNVSGFTLEALSEFEVTNSDNYILMLDSNPLMSYDASRFNYAREIAEVKSQPHRGRRINILATIPVNNNATGIVEFEANELVYIDLDNRMPQNLKNLRLRILDKNFNEIKTTGTSVLTLLVNTN